MLKNKQVLVFVLLFAAISLKAQDKVNLLNGKVLEGTVTSTADEKISLTMTSKKGKVFDTYIENYRAFSILSKDGSETIIYKQDSTIGNFLTVPDMQFYLLGEQDAYKNYRPMGTMILGTTLGIGLGIFDTYNFGDPADPTVAKGFFKSGPGFLTIFYPFIFTAIAGIAPRPQLDIHNISNRNNLNSEHFIQGFARVARFKRTIRAFVFSFAGSALGLGSYYLFR